MYSRLICILLFVAISCTQRVNPNIERGSNYMYRSGFPEVRCSVFGFLNQNNQPHISIAADIVFESLVYKEADGVQKANILIEVRARGKKGNNVVLSPKPFRADIIPDESGTAELSQSYLFEKNIEASAGNYEVDITVTDLNSGKTTTRTSPVTVPRIDSDNNNLSNIRMLGKDLQGESSWSPITTYDVPGRVDSLMFLVQVTNNVSENPLLINSNLYDIEADLSVARPMSFSNYSPSTIEYQGINYDNKTLLHESTRKLLDKGSVFIEFRFKQQPRGNYRFELRTKNNDTELFKAREFSIKSENYPILETPRELARPLIYLMDENKYEDMMSIEDRDSLKRVIDHFWLNHIGNEIEARQVLEKYYHRVEEANKQFSNFKEGWKTDPGMVYILFGPPWYVQNTLGEMEWNYSYYKEEPGRTFFFNQPRRNTEFYPFEHYLLQRNRTFYSLEYQQRQLWLSGLILSRDL